MTKKAKGWWKVNFEINLEYEDEHENCGEGVQFKYLSKTTQEHILKCIADGCFQGEIVEEYETEEENYCNDGDNNGDEPVCDMCAENK